MTTAARCLVTASVCAASAAFCAHNGDTWLTLAIALLGGLYLGLALASGAEGR